MALFASLPEHGTSVLIASHDLGLVKRMKKRVLVLDHGTLVDDIRSEEHTSELQSLMRISYAVFCLKKKNKINTTIMQNIEAINTHSIYKSDLDNTQNNTA